MHLLLPATDMDAAPCSEAFVKFLCSVAIASLATHVEYGATGVQWNSEVTRPPIVRGILRAIEPTFPNISSIR